MDWNTAFLMINAAVLPAWFLLIFLPRSKLTAAAVHSAFYPAVMGAIYAGALGAGVFFGQSAQGAGFSSIEAVSAIFDHPNGVVIGWTHYLAFDLFVGAWIGRDAIRLAIPHAAVIPCLIGAFMFGPVGLLMYVLLRFMLRKKWSLQA
ncbi:ABA4-like family protein [Hyphococcus sp.]|uniref:ABA4-like family protein n=1 Tax=Hyphococcus sp. TaxID=2038636 RepID=UPI003CCBCB4C